jgi:hypothetical protein
MEHQDWETVKLRGRRVEMRDPAAIAKRDAARRLEKLDEDLAPKRKRLTVESRRGLAAARAAVKKTQREIDALCAFPPNSVRDFESGTVVPSGAQIGSLHRMFAAQGLVLRVETV